MRGKLKGYKSILCCSRCKIRVRYVYIASPTSQRCEQKNLSPGLCDKEQILICGFDLVKIVIRVSFLTRL